MQIKQFADQREENGAAAAIARAPEHIRRSINAVRATRGLSPVLSVADAQALAERQLADQAAVQAREHRGTGVWLNGPGGTLVPASRSRSIPVRPAARSTPSAPTRGTRVLMLVAYGEAPAANVRGELPEAIAGGAFGSADELNKVIGSFDLRSGHRGPRLAVAGSRLRAIDSRHGLIVEWLPNERSWDREAVRAIESGRNAVSVGMKVRQSRTARLPYPTRFITDARLDHVALLLDGDERPAYAGACARVFRFAALDDEAELRRHIDALVASARFKSNRARRRV